MSDYAQEPIEYATYDPGDNKLRVYSDHVGKELFARFKELKFQRAYTQGCFFATWTPEREDLVLELCQEIETEGSTLQDRADDRAERFSDYSTNAVLRMKAASEASSAAVRHIPPGQPILINHHSEGKHRAALKRSRRQATKSVEEWKKSNYWTSRAEGVASHAERKFAPGPTLRRIKKLKAQRRKEIRRRDETADAWTIEQWLNKHTPKEQGNNWTPLRDRLASLSEEQGQALRVYLDKRAVKLVVYYNRWIAHIDGQIEFWQAVYDASPAAKAAKKFDLKKGGWVFNGRGWAQIKRVNKAGGEINSVSIDLDTCTANWMPRIVKYPEIKGYNETGPE